ncbi:FAD binding domain-containing protein [Natronococcus occultus]|uniref:Aerobic-type carbon monoxide dehydrogenase, middle subunit CoxM/CutM-like protein n=1 Tax=Natronococcus occultus SP4 TaxID=694430 RepID=L0K1M6_9EURY|nr:FAD binding domain-containing protein [Natronococcus occultus]AGB38881.1 aerobic-type carbon monoxide dehydrogenase, middle subunit CoxM/CutM-like protein [Natronococcus occultus SP4]
MSIRHQTECVCVESVDEALALLSEDTDTRVLGGGYSLVPLLKDGIETPDRLVDITAVPSLRGITREKATLRIGAVTTHDRIAASTAVRERARALADATDSVGDFQAKHRGTIAGNLVFADPKYDAPAAFLALDGRLVVRGPDGERTIDADDWFRGPGETACHSDELVTEIVVPNAQRSGYVRTSEYSGYAIVGAAAVLETDGDAVTRARVAVNGAKPYPIRLPSVERTLVGGPIDDESLTAAADAASEDIDPAALIATDTAAGQHRLRLVQSYCRRAIARAIADH